jgi:DNA-binding SARP family transcriptional activator/predicted ATPase
VTSLELFFLGTLEIRSEGNQLPNPPTLKSQSLLAYLVCHRSQPQPRDRLVGLFYGERPERKAHRCLSTALWHIRRCLPDESALLSDSQTVQFDPQRKFWLDLEAFESYASRSDTTGLQTAAALYRGDFLDGFYDDWIISERYRLEALFIEVLARLIVLHETGKDYQAALATALRLLSRDSLREDAHRIVMRAYCCLGQRKAALDQYDRCCRTLLDELDTPPMGETTELYKAILEGRFEVGLSPKTSQKSPLLVLPAGRNPLDVTASIRLVGREQEMVFLENCWQKAQSGYASLVLVSGEVGVGKTRLVEEFTRRLRWQGSQVLWGRCYEFERALPYQPVVEALRTALPGLTQAELDSFPAWVLKEAARLIPEVLERTTIETGTAHRRKMAGDSGPVPAAAPVLNPQQARLFEGITRLLATLVSQGVRLVVLEDLHWANESSLQLIHHLARRLSVYPVLFVGTFRPEDIGVGHPLPELHRQLARDGLVQQLDLPRLNHDSVITIVQEMSGTGDAARTLAERLYHETEGNPFFLMELIKALFETGVIQLKEGTWHGDFNLASEAKPLLTDNLSDTVQGRVLRLGGDAQAALGLAAVLGREFNYEPFKEAWDRGEEATLEALEELLRHRLVEEQFDPDHPDFKFTHHKIQEVVYQGLPRQRRFHLHARAGTAMETVYSAELETRAGELAHHFEQACLQDRSWSDKAIHYLSQAGQQAMRQSANPEAVAYYRRGLAILHSQPETEQRMRQEIELQIALAAPIMAIRGYASPEARAIYDRVGDLCQRLSDTPGLFTSLVGLNRYYGLSGDFRTGSRLAEQMVSIARANQKNDLLLVACSLMGSELFSVGKFQEARAFYQKGLGLYDPAKHEFYASRFGHDPAVTCLGYMGQTLWLLGFPNQSQVHSQNLSNLISSMTHSASQAYACCHLAKHACFRRDAHTARHHAENAIQISHQHGLASWNALATALKGWALCAQGEMAEGWTLLEDGIQAWRGRNLTHWTPFLLALQAEAALQMHKQQEGIDVITAALEIGQDGGDLYWLAELYRLQGELTQAKGADAGIVEGYFQQAIETARQQGARMLELRAAVSLVRLHMEHGQPSAPLQMLTEIYHGFTEGFDTVDLIQANDLLVNEVAYDSRLH